VAWARYRQAMSATSLQARARAVSAATADRALALVAAVAAVLETALAHHGAASTVATYPAAISIALALAWRRRSPLAAATIAGVAIAIQSPLDGQLDRLTVTWIASLFLLASVGYHEARGRSQAALAVVVVALWVSKLLDPPVDVSDLAFTGAVMAGAWFLGRAFRNRRLLAVALRERADHLEREQDEQARLAAAHERARIARELHDVIAHHVSVMVVQAEAADEVLDDRPESARAAIRSVQSTGREALVELRRLLGVLRVEHDAALGPAPGLAALDELVAQTARTGLAIELRFEGAASPLAPGVDLTAYRIVQEALTNTLKHADASTARIRVAFTAGHVELEIADDGCGARTQPGGRTGHGLIGMHERALLCGGELSVGPTADGGYLVRARLPSGAAA
jgi:signal transduction histidine kinase